MYSRVQALLLLCVSLSLLYFNDYRLEIFKLTSFDLSIASIRCRQKIRSSCTYDWSLTPLYTPPPNVRMCCGLHFYSSVCMSNWNDKKLYSVPSVYVEQQSPICRLLNVPDFVILTCGYWIRPKDVEPLLTWNQAPKGLDKFNLIDNCTM